jgi:hypothetical protein
LGGGRGVREVEVLRRRSLLEGVKRGWEGDWKHRLHGVKGEGEAWVEERRRCELLYELDTRGCLWRSLKLEEQNK